MRRLRARAGEERGQAIALVALMMVPLLALTGFVIDIGYAYYVQRSLQSTADAAALAGAQKLPDSAAAVGLAKQYGSSGSAKNFRANAGSVDETVTTRCLTSVPGCSPVNAVVVDETAHPKTLFLRVLGFDNFTVHTRSTACSPCGVKPLDIVMVLDRTLSMCMDHNGRLDPSCTDLNNARSGMKTFLNLMDPQMDRVGLVVLPPATSVANRCAVPQTSNYDSRSAAYVVVPLSNDYKTGTRLNTSSRLVSTIDCQQGGGETSYANALEQAQAELDAHGRSNVQDVIVFFSDGAANTGPSYYGNSSPYRSQPCHQGVNSAAAAKAKGTIIYSIGYDLNALNGGANNCTAYSFTGPPESPPITAYQALSQIASSSATFYNQPSAGELTSLFTQVATDVQRGAARLIDNSTP
jgi:uncharacterized membrane protein